MHGDVSAEQWSLILCSDHVFDKFEQSPNGFDLLTIENIDVKINVMYNLFSLPHFRSHYGSLVYIYLIIGSLAQPNTQLFCCSVAQRFK